jgi:hypothetical protein
MRTLAVTLFVLSLVPAIADANGSGGGGTKPTSSVRIRNNGSNTLAVIVDPSPSIQDALEAGTLSTSTFLSAGGRFVGRNGSTTFGGLRAGAHTAVAAFVSSTSNSATVSTVGAAEANVARNQTVTFTATGSVSSGATLSGP